VSSLLISGESGTGKEIAARIFHLSGGKSGAPFATVNCATIPRDLAERLLFGSRRGAYSGATDAQGHVQAAHGGTLFLDEVAELPPDVQSKLLRMLETHEVLRLGATSYERVDVRVCAATWRNLREEVAAGRFREDLYFRIGQPEIRLPPLRERPDEIPWHVQQVLDASSTQRPISATAAFIDACAQRDWPGNVRELRAEIRRASAVTFAHGSDALSADDLSPTAGVRITRAEAPGGAAFPQDAFAAALTAEGGNVVGAARRLGIHRNRVRRWLERHAVDAGIFKQR
jgi:transcriptional regulator with PAS, ATPase and Fis domain